MVYRRSPSGGAELAMARGARQQARRRQGAELANMAMARQQQARVAKAPRRCLAAVAGAGADLRGPLSAWRLAFRQRISPIMIPYLPSVLCFWNEPPPFPMRPFITDLISSWERAPRSCLVGRCGPTWCARAPCSGMRSTVLWAITSAPRYVTPKGSRRSALCFLAGGL